MRDWVLYCNLVSRLVNVGLINTLSSVHIVKTMAGRTRSTSTKEGTEEETLDHNHASKRVALSVIRESHVRTRLESPEGWFNDLTYHKLLETRIGLRITFDALALQISKKAKKLSTRPARSAVVDAVSRGITSNP